MKASVLCLAAAVLLLTVSLYHALKSHDQVAWTIGGLLALALGLTLERLSAR